MYTGPKMSAIVSKYSVKWVRSRKYGLNISIFPGTFSQFLHLHWSDLTHVVSQDADQLRNECGPQNLLYSLVGQTANYFWLSAKSKLHRNAQFALGAVV